jgi:rhombotail lipoprotein
MNIRILLLGVAAASCFGCVSQQLNQRSNALEYLYSGGAEARAATAVKIQTPVRVGLAFAPASSTTRETFTENQKQELLQRLATKFASRKGIESIEIIPGNYINPKGGFDELDRLRASFRINQVVLLSYDQVQFSDSGGLSLTYLVTYGAGMYVVKGEKNETRTMMDAVVYDIPSRTMLFHAVGQNSIKGSSTFIGIAKAMRERSAEGFNQATDDLITNLDSRFTSFVASIKDDTVMVEATPAIPAWNATGNSAPTTTPAMAQPVTTTPAANMGTGGGGGGATSLLELVMLLCAAAGLGSRKHWARCSKRQ